MTYTVSSGTLNTSIPYHTLATAAGKDNPDINPAVAIISPAAGLCAKSIISPGRTDTSGLKIDFCISPAAAIFRLAQMVPPIEYDWGYRFRRRTLNPNFNRNRNKVFERKQRTEYDTEIKVNKELYF